MPPDHRGRPRGQEPTTHQYRTAYEVGTQNDVSSIGHGHPDLNGQLWDRAGLGAAIQTATRRVGVLQGSEISFFPGPDDVSGKARGWSDFQVLG